MTFSRPFAGTFAYEGLIPSSAMNAINNAFPDILDKTGDTITGIIEIAAAGGELSFLSGSYLETLSGSNVAIAGSFIFESIATVSSNTNITMDLGSNIVLNGSSSGLNVLSGALINYSSGSHITGNMEWTAGSTSPSIGQDALVSGTGAEMTIAAQTTSSGFGGNLILASGEGSEGDGKVELNVGSTIAFGVSDVYDVFYPGVGDGGGGSALSVYAFQNSPTQVYSQLGINNLIPFFIHTGASGSNTTVYTLAVPTNTGVAMQINWMYRVSPGGGAGFTSQLTLINANNDAGTVTVYNQDLYTGTHSGTSVTSGGSGANLAIIASSTNIVITAIAAASSIDWQIFLSYQQI